MLIVGLISFLLGFAPVADFKSAKMTAWMQAGAIITAPVPPWLAAGSAVRPSWISAGAKPTPVNFLTAKLSSLIGTLSCCRYNRRPDVGLRFEAEQFGVISVRSPPYFLSRV